MTSASEPVAPRHVASPQDDVSIDAREAAHFGAMAREWWDPAGSSAMLHRLNPPRLGYIREQVDLHWSLDGTSFHPLAGKRALDMGCGAGLLTEPLARLGADTVGIDAAAENIAAANLHAVQSGLAIEYRTGGIQAIGADRFDLITSLEVVEHVADQPGFIAALANALADDGILILSTPNRTALSRLALIGLAEGTGAIPRGTHDWDRFLTPDDLTGLVEAAGLVVRDVRGLGYTPTRGFVVQESTKLDYLMTAVRRR